MKAFHKSLLALFFALMGAQLASAHIRVYPQDSAVGAREKYIMRAPNESNVDCVKIEGEYEPL